jgi:hypothetical protein
MSPDRALRPPTFRSAVLVGGPEGGILPPRPLGRTVGLSLLLHAVAAAGLLVLSLLTIESVSPPPIVIRFLAAPPLAPRLVPLRERPDLQAPPPEPVTPPRPAEPVPIPALRLPPPPPPARLRPEPPPLEAEAIELPRSVTEAAPEPRIRDAAPPAPRLASASLGRVGAAAPLPGVGGEEPDLVFLTPGRARPRGEGGGVAGRGDALPPLPPGLSGAGSARGGAAGRGGSGGDGDDRGLETGGGAAAGGLASFLGRKYGVVLVEAARLGQRTSDGSRYSLLVPMLSEAYRGIRLRGTWRAAAGEGYAASLASAQVASKEIALRYRDGTLHVLVPTSDGLVALYVSAGGGGTTGRGKVDEAERALVALRRLAEERR